MQPSFEKKTFVQPSKSELEGSSSTRSKLEHVYGFTPEEIGTLEHQAELLKPHVRIAIRTPLSALESILHDGHLKAASETGTSIGFTGGDTALLDRMDEYVNARKKFESSNLPWSEGDPAIIYGLLGYSDELEDSNIHAPVYGNVELKLRDETLERSSFTAGDSLYERYDSPSDFLNLDDAILMQQALERDRQLPARPPSGRLLVAPPKLSKVNFIEAQIRGGVTTQDVESATITIEPTKLNQQIIDSLHKLHTQAPDCKIVVNLDYTGPQNFPTDIIGDLDFVEFRSIIIHKGEPMFIARNGINYRDREAKSIEDQYLEDQARISVLGGKFLAQFEKHEKLENFSGPTLTYFRGGDRFPPEN